MNYIEVTFDLTCADDFIPDVLAAQLGNAGFESFVQEKDKLLAYCPENLFSVSKMQEALSLFPILLELTYEIKNIREQNWNEEWEKNSFKPIIIDNKCIVHSPQKNIGDFDIDIIIDPHLAFGTASHETTQLIISEMLNINFSETEVLDMGCGTGVLSILASKLNAKNVTAIDIDKFSYENTIHNAALNRIKNIVAKQGDASLLHDMNFDVILANINRNILLRDMPFYCNVLKENGIILFSGFYAEDIKRIEESAEAHRLQKISERIKNNWAVVTFKKCRQ